VRTSAAAASTGATVDRAAGGSGGLAWPVAAMVAVAAIGTAMRLWESWWWALLAAEFTLLVFAADAFGRRLTLRRLRGYHRALAFLFPLLALASWELLARSEILNPRWFPPPTTIARALWDLTVNVDGFSGLSLLGRPWLLPRRVLDSGWAGVRATFAESHLWSTLARVLFGFALGSVPGVVVGMAMGLNKTVRAMLDATMSAVYVVPKIAIFPLLMLVFADPFGEGPKVSVVGISAFFLVALSTMAGVQGLEPVLLDAGKNFGAGRWQMFRHVVLPGAMPIIFNGLRLALGTSLIVIVAVEFVRSRTGVGYLVYYHWQVLSIPKMYASLLVIMGLGVALTAILQAVERRVMPWRRQ